MDTEKLFEKKTTVDVNVLKVDNKKMTKGIFNQLHWNSPFDKLYNLKANVKLLGYVNDKSNWLIWTNGEDLYKYEINKFYLFRTIDFDKNTIAELVKVYPSEEVESLNSCWNDVGFYEYQESQISTVLSRNEQYSIIDKKESVDKIVKEVLKRQIFV